MFRDGKRLVTKARRPPRRWRRALGTRVRFYGADALAVSAAPVRSVTVYDRRGRRVARARV